MTRPFERVVQDSGTVDEDGNIIYQFWKDGKKYLCYKEVI